TGEAPLGERDPDEVERSACIAPPRRRGGTSTVVRRAVDDDDLERRRVDLARERGETRADRRFGAIRRDDDRKGRLARRRHRGAAQYKRPKSVAASVGGTYDPIPCRKGCWPKDPRPTSEKRTRTWSSSG